MEVLNPTVQRDAHGFVVLDERAAENGHLHVTLKHHLGLAISVVEVRHDVGGNFDLVVPDGARPHDVFWHPYAYAGSADMRVRREPVEA